jgi:membrane-associated protease RseP (regulator of RpoE activity)
MNATTTSGRRPWLNGLLFGLTLLTTWFAGLSFAQSFVSAGTEGPGPSLFAPRVLSLGLLYALTLMIILTGHELGHYLTCRRYRIQATYPFFLPGPPFLGTFGAFIRIKSPVYFKRQIFDVGANGPLTGFLLALPALVLGMAFSRVGPLAATAGTISFGEPLLFRLLGTVFFGRIPEGSFLILHPAGFAGWVGLLVTALNLMPIGQLDGGHISYAVLGRRARLLSRLMIVFLLLMGLFFFMTWLVFAVLILVLEVRSRARFRHPPVVDEGAPLGLKRTVLGLALLAIFVLSFIPDPIKDFSLIDVIKGGAGPLR